MVKEVYASEMALQAAETRLLPEQGMSARCAQTLIRDELRLDGNAQQNLASFVTTYMEPEVEALMVDSMRVNFIDQDEYPQTTDIHRRCVNILGNLWHAQAKNNKGDMVGTGTVGSSEAIMLAVLAMKWRWKAWRREQGLPVGDREPNIVFGSNVQCCWHKACRYFEVESREADVSPDKLVLTADRAEPLLDEYTIGVCPILGSTFNGEFEDVKGICEMLRRVNEERGWQIFVHVDAASGGFIAPFTRPELIWDFRIPEVKSINASGHKFGLCYAGIGWLAFRDEASCPDDLVTHVNYLGGDQASLTLNFSKPASPIIAQYYQFLRLGREGYTSILKNGLLNASYLRDMIMSTGQFVPVDTGDMPLVAFAMKDPARAGFTLFDLQDALKARGWTLPAYRCSRGAENYVIMRAVVKQNLSRNMIHLLMADIVNAIAYFQQHPTHLLHPRNEEALQKASKAATGRDDGPTAEEAEAMTHTGTKSVITKLINGNVEHIAKDGARTHGVC